MGAVYSKCCKSKSFEFDNNNSSAQQSQLHSNRLPTQTISVEDLSQISTIQNSVKFETVVLKNKTENEGEKVLCKATEINENEMKEFAIDDDDKKVLVIKQNDKYYAIGANCSHYGAPLSMGSLGEGRIRCPWHGACFNIKTGDIEDYPGLDSLPCYEIKIRDDDIILLLKKKPEIVTKTVKKRNETFVIIGGGPSSQTCVETLRQNGFMGRIIMVCKEEHLPYDRMKISKILNSTIEDVQLRPNSFYMEKNIEFMLNTEAIDMDFKIKEIILSNGKNIKYDKAFIATGSRPRIPKIHGIELQNIFFLRTLNDAQSLHKQLVHKNHVVILGSGFIAIELAAYAVAKCAKVTIVSTSTWPLQRALGDAVGKKIMNIFEEKGVHFIMECGIENFFALNQDQNVSAVQLTSGEFLRADICVIAIGSKFNTKFLRGSGIDFKKDGSVDTNEFLETNIPDVYVGGDIANSPIFVNGNERASIGHYAVAQYHGRIAGLNMLGRKAELKTVPYFSTHLFEHCFAYAGYGEATEVIIEGNMDDLQFYALYFDSVESLVAIGAFQPHKNVSDIAEKMTQGIKFSKNEVILYLDLKNTKTEPFISDKYKSMEEEFIEKVLCDASDINENEMKEFVIDDDDKKVLVIKQNDKYHAIGANCSHYGAPLSMGSLGEGRIRCPWHGACFNIKTGDIEDYPGLDSLPCYEVKVYENKVKVKINKRNLKQEKFIKKMAQRDPANDEIYLIIGGGPSSQTCVETLRQNGFMGRIIMVCKEEHLPYDRMKISKILNSTIEDVQLRPHSFYDDNSIETLLGSEVVFLNTSNKQAILDTGNKLSYNKLFIATGSRPRFPKIPGSHLQNIFTLRTIDDASKIDSRLHEKAHVIILGSSFLAMEVASYCVGKSAKLTIVSRNLLPLEETFGGLIGEGIKKWFESKKVNFIMQSGIKKFLGNNEIIESVELENGEVIWADVCVIGIGSEFNTEFLKGSGVTLNTKGSIDTNEFLETNIPDVYVGGDIANSPIFVNGNERASIGHYAVAQYHGRIAGLNMLGRKTELKTVPYFSTHLFEHCFTYTGHGEAEEAFVDGDLDDFNFVAFYFDSESVVVGMSSSIPDTGITAFAEKLHQGFKYHRDDIEWAIETQDNEE